MLDLWISESMSDVPDVESESAAVASAKAVAFAATPTKGENPQLKEGDEQSGDDKGGKAAVVASPSASSAASNSGSSAMKRRNVPEKLTATLRASIVIAGIAVPSIVKIDLLMAKCHMEKVFGSSKMVINIKENLIME